MKKLTIKDAIREVLQKKKQAMSTKEIYEAIVAENLYEFNTKTPQSIVNAEIRKNCEGINLKNENKTKLFKLATDGRYAIK